MTVTRDDFGVGPNAECGVSPILPLTNPQDSIKKQRDSITTAINNLAPEGGTAIPQGLVWGWRVISPSEPYVEGSDDPRVKKVIILLTDGANNLGLRNNTIYRTYFTAYGSSWPLPPTPETLDKKTLIVCTNIKSDGIALYTITFGADVGSTAKGVMSSCATTPSNYYHAASSDALRNVFQEIAGGIRKLRLVE